MRREFSRARMRVGVALVAATAALALWTPGGAVAAGPVAPSADPFYVYSGSLAGVAPGTVLRTRKITLALADMIPALSATQVLYRTTDQLGAPSATVATIISPLLPAGTTPRLLSYQTAYDGVSDTCRPSFQLQGGTPTNSILVAENPLILAYAAQGYTIVTSDYEGPTDDYGAGREEGYNTLDGIRAAEHDLGLTASATPVGLIGYSGGSIASMWAAELQPGYAPELDINGVAAGGIPVDFTHNLAYISGSSDWAGAIPAVSIGLFRAYHLNIAQYVNAKGAEIASEVEKGCLNPTAYPGLTLSQMLKPQYADWQKVPALARIFNDSIMGRGGTPREPLMLGVGNADGIGDGVMVAKDVQQLAYEYCQRGVNVQFHVYTGLNHVEALPDFEADAITFLQERYGGQAVPSGCSSITPGNPLTPIPEPAPPPAPRLKLHLSSGSHGVAVALSTAAGVAHGVTVELERGGAVEAKRTIATITTHARRIVLRVHGHAPAAGRYTVVVMVGGTTAARRAVTVHG